MSVTRLDADDTVLLDFGKDYAVRAPGNRNWYWLHREVEHSSGTDVLTRSGEPTLIAVQGSDPNNDWVDVYAVPGGDRLLSMPLSDSGFRVAVADTALYALDSDDSVVAGYDLETGEELWTVPVPADEDAEPQGIRAIDGGFQVRFGQSHIRFSDGNT